MKHRTLLTLCFILISTYLLHAQNYGGSDYSPNTACYDTNYSDIEIWATAGVTGGIPKITNIKKTLLPGEDIQEAIDNGGTGVVLLTNGTYVINKSITLKSGVVLRGESKSGVKLSVTIKVGDAITFESNTSYAGLENLRLVYEALPNNPTAYRTGMQDGAYCSECFQNDEPDYTASLVRIDGNNNWVDNIDAMKSGSDPVEMKGDHNTFRNSLVENCYNKGGGGEGYFDIRGDKNLVNGCTVRLIRHFAIQQKAKYNVIINNTIEVDINFHNGDEGHNLIESNTIIRPSWHTWGVFATGGSAYGHEKPGLETVIVNNTCYDYREKRKEWDEPNVIYTYEDYGEPTKTDLVMPQCGTFYAVSSLSTNTTNIKKSAFDTVSASPNPFSNYITVDLNGTDVNLVKLYNTKGQIIYSQVVYNNTNELKVFVDNKYKNGLYFLQMVNNSTVRTIKLLKI